jgi:hypothetical protein
MKVWRQICWKFGGEMNSSSMRRLNSQNSRKIVDCVGHRWCRRFGKGPMRASHLWYVSSLRFDWLANFRLKHLETGPSPSPAWVMVKDHWAGTAEMEIEYKWSVRLRIWNRIYIAPVTSGKPSFDIQTALPQSPNDHDRVSQSKQVLMTRESRVEIKFMGWRRSR